MKNKRINLLLIPVSYTHLDVYKRQLHPIPTTDKDNSTNVFIESKGNPHAANAPSPIDVYKRQDDEWYHEYHRR